MTYTLQNIIKCGVNAPTSEKKGEESGMIKLARCDDRLIHGQCITQVVPMYGITQIIAIDKATAENPMLKKIFMNAAPAGVKAVPFTYEEALPRIQKVVASPNPTLLLIRTPDVYEKLLADVPELPKELNVACVPKGDIPCKEVSPGTYFTDEVIASCNRMDDAGVRIWIQRIISDPITEWHSVRGKFS